MTELKELKNLNAEQLLTIVEREKSKRSFYEFFKYVIKYCYPHIEFEDNWHYEVICNILDKEVRRMVRKEPAKKHLIINLPIRCGKTILISEIFPVYLWITNPGWMIQSVCATQRLATKSSRMSKLIIDSNWFQSRFPEIKLAEDHQSKSDYGTVNNGTRASYGVSSSQIGTSYDCLICDDLNDPTDIHSDAALNAVTSAYDDVIVGRQNNEWALRVILQQRTSERDLCQHLLDNSNDYRHICIPAEITEETKNVTPAFIEYYKDGLFFPKRYSRARLAKYKTELSGQAYASQLMQAPSSLAGEVVLRRWFKVMEQSQYQKLVPGKVFLFLDTAYTDDNKNNDPTGFLICTLINHRIFVLKAYNDWLEFPDLITEIMDIITTYDVKRVYCETKATGISIIQELRRQLRGKVSVLGINPKAKSKMERVRAAQPYLSAMQVVVVKDTWNEDFLSQVASFPFGKHDDMLDCLVYSVLTLLTGKPKPQEEQEDKPKSERGMIPEQHDDIYDNLY